MALKMAGIQKEDSDVVKKLKALMTGNHDDNAVPIIAHPGEVVLNEKQQRMLISNFEKYSGFITDATTICLCVRFS